MAALSSEPDFSCSCATLSYIWEVTTVLQVLLTPPTATPFPNSLRFGGAAVLDNVSRASGKDGSAFWLQFHWWSGTFRDQRFLAP